MEEGTKAAEPSTVHVRLQHAKGLVGLGMLLSQSGTIGAGLIAEALGSTLPAGAINAPKINAVVDATFLVPEMAVAFAKTMREDVTASEWGITGIAVDGAAAKHMPAMSKAGPEEQVAIAIAHLRSVPPERIVEVWRRSCVDREDVTPDHIAQMNAYLVQRLIYAIVKFQLGGPRPGGAL